MKGIDTNVLVRFLVQDDEHQATVVHQLFSEAEQHKQTLLVTNLVLLETIWVLESVYEVERGAVLDSIDDLLMLPVLEFEKQPVVRRFLESARQSALDLSDGLIGQWAKELDCDAVLTFDKKAAKTDLFEEILPVL